MLFALHRRSFTLHSLGYHLFYIFAGGFELTANSLSAMDSSEALMKLLSNDENLSAQDWTCSRCQEITSKGSRAKRFSTLKLLITFGLCQVLVVLVLGFIALIFFKEKSIKAEDYDSKDC